MGSVDSLKRQEANRRLIDMYRAHPVRNPAGNINVLDNKENGGAMSPPQYYQQPAVPRYNLRKPPLPLEYERRMYVPPPLPLPAYANPMRQAARAVLERPHYNLRPVWWG